MNFLSLSFLLSVAITAATATAAAAAAATKTATVLTKPVSNFNEVSVCNLQTKIIQCSDNSTRLDIGVAIYGRFPAGKQCLKKFERPSKKACLKGVSARISKQCNGKTSCKLSTTKLPTNCKTTGSQKLYVLYVCRPQHRIPPTIRKIISLYRRPGTSSANYGKRLTMLKPHSTLLTKYVKNFKLERSSFRKRALQRLRKEFNLHERKAKTTDSFEYNKEEEEDKALMDVLNEDTDSMEELEDGTENSTESSKPEPEPESTETDDEDADTEKVTTRTVKAKNPANQRFHYNFSHVNGSIVITNDFH